ncbi:hypothetical protein [Clostridium estertheticum]|uniref:hypothetical protein n=1 Tax=Clostridium estertheticum TaxID=238834 RepID=UPI001C7DBBCF|nr:hypothetical protein [Clostridium estertheticum]MBX4271468.1 hypothetical protein [Clostridium estertheticum]WLC81020.1 hypothetical protein KTC98_07300 [Clostridium estertheticum]
MKEDILCLRVNVETELIKTLEKTYQFIKEAEDDIYAWKWIIISLHNAVQNCMVIALKGSSTFGVLNKKSRKEWFDWYNKNSEYPQMKMELFLELFKKIKCDNGKELNDYAKKINGNNQIDNSMKLLNEYRNEFIHFIPKSWVLILSGVPQICIDVLTVIDFLVTESGKITFYDDADGMKKSEKSIFEIKTKLIELQRKYNNNIVYMQILNNVDIH